MSQTDKRKRRKMKNSISSHKQYTLCLPSSSNENIFSSIGLSMIQFCGFYIFILKTALIPLISPLFYISYFCLPRIKKH